MWSYTLSTYSDIGLSTLNKKIVHPVTKPIYEPGTLQSVTATIFFSWRYNPHGGLYFTAL